MLEHHYNPTELASDEYLLIEQKVKDLAKTARTKQEFIDKFNEIWRDGPFSHVSLGRIERRAEEMAEFVDSLRVGEHSVSLDWMDQTAILTVTTMMGVDTKDRVVEAYQEIAGKEAKSLIIDLRNNTGGTFAGVPLIGHILTDFIDAGIFVSQKWWKNNSKAPDINDIQGLKSWHGWTLKSFWHDVQQEPLTRVKFKSMQPNFNGQVYVLTSKKTASVAEFTVDAMAQEKNVIVIGETTAGEMLSQKMFDLPYGFQISIPIAEYYSTRIGKIEGVGIQPHIAIAQSVSMNVAISLINGENQEDALSKAKLEMDKKEKEAFDGETIYLFGTMNDWGKKRNITPRFEFKGNGMYQASATLKKGSYEFKIAPMNWSFDYGANPNEENVPIGKKYPLARVSGSSNLIINLEVESNLTFLLNVSDEMTAVLSVSVE